MQLEYLEQLFHEHSWQPFTQMKLVSPVFIERGEGTYLFNTKGEPIIDAIGSWWVNIHGHNNPFINASIIKQLESLEHVVYAGLSHAPATLLAQKLSATTDHELKRVFYSDNGSTAVEIALKMAYQYFWNQGQPERREFITLGGGYHGDTFGAMSVGSRGAFHNIFNPLLFDCHSLPQPDCPFVYFYDSDRALKEVRPTLRSLESLFLRKAKLICGLILEPVIQGASAGFNFYPPVLLERLHALCEEEGVFLIADEVFTGCGRTGSFYACQKAGIWPDIITLSKGLTGGYLPFAATLTSETIYQGFYSDERAHTLFHGHSMTANPLGCAAALASLELIESDEHPKKIDRIERLHVELQEKLKRGPLQQKIKECRALGSVGVLELQTDSAYTADFGWKVMQRALQAGVLLRPLGNTIYVTPPYCISAEDLEKVYAIMQAAVSAELG